MCIRDREKVVDTNHRSPRHKSCCWLCDLCPQQSPTFTVHCNGLNTVRMTQTGLLRTCHGLCRKHLDMSRWFVFTTFMIYVGDFYQNFMISWFVTVWVCDFHDMCPSLSLWGSFDDSWCNGIWALPEFQPMLLHVRLKYQHREHC